MKLHELVQSSESVAERCILDALFVSYYEVVEGQQRLDAVYKEMPITRNAADWIAEQRQVHDLRDADKSLDIAPVADVVVVQVQELELTQACKNLRWRQACDRVVAQIDLL
jgi:hypothetical protein